MTPIPGNYPSLAYGNEWLVSCWPKTYIGMLDGSGSVAGLSGATTPSRQTLAADPHRVVAIGFDATSRLSLADATFGITTKDIGPFHKNPWLALVGGNALVAGEHNGVELWSEQTGRWWTHDDDPTAGKPCVCADAANSRAIVLWMGNASTTPPALKAQIVALDGTVLVPTFTLLPTYGGWHSVCAATGDGWMVAAETPGKVSLLWVHTDATFAPFAARILADAEYTPVAQWQCGEFSDTTPVMVLGRRTSDNALMLMGSDGQVARVGTTTNFYFPRVMASHGEVCICWSENQTTIESVVWPESGIPWQPRSSPVPPGPASPVTVSPMPRPLLVFCDKAAGDRVQGLDASLYAKAPGNAGMTGLTDLMVPSFYPAGASLADLAALKPLVIHGDAATLDAAKPCWNRVMAVYASDEQTLADSESAASYAHSNMRLRGLTQKPVICNMRPADFLAAGRAPVGIDILGLEAGYVPLVGSPADTMAVAGAIVPALDWLARHAPQQAVCLVCRAYLWQNPTPLEIEAVCGIQQQLFDLARVYANIVAIDGFCWGRALQRGMKDQPAMAAYYTALTKALPPGLPAIFGGASPPPPQAGTLNPPTVNITEWPPTLKPGSKIVVRDPNNGQTVELDFLQTANAGVADLHVSWQRDDGKGDRSGLTRLVKVAS